MPADEAFQVGCPHMAERPTDLCLPGKFNGDCHTAGLSTYPVLSQDEGWVVTM
ncbi:MAG: hypothetical protein ACYDEY_16090 [Acidimicrobiales bacterium]